jgi:hypothetical protein
MKKSFTCLSLGLVFLAGLGMAQEAHSRLMTIPKKSEVDLSRSGAVPEREQVREMPPQGPRFDSPRQKVFSFPRKAEVDFSEIRTDLAPNLMVREMPRQGASKVHQTGQTISGARYSRSSSTILPLQLGENLLANPFSINTPNDNDLAISDSGKVLSVINTNIYVRDTKAGVSSPVKSLFSFTQPINNLQDEFDPKVLYDPQKDRFVLACMVGFVDSTSKIILGFSKTNNPAGQWHLYELPGDALNNNLWSDYPMIAMSEKELFLSVNLLYNDSSWQTGFVETIVWQMAKDSGFAGKNLTSKLHSNIKHNGRAIRNLCPVKGGSRLYGPDMYFISNRNLDSQNDTMFIVRITDLIAAPNASVTVKVVKTDLPYRFPPDGIQKGTGQTLATNDSRNLGAFFENDRIQFVHNTKHPVNNRPTVQYGVIHQPGSASPVVNCYVVENDSADYAYPNISYAGLDSTDNSAIITFNHSSTKVYPGCSAIQADALGDFSPVLKIRDGSTYVNLLQSTLERWGDYSGSQRRYNKPGEVWMSGYFASPYNSQFPYAHAAWVAQITTDKALHVNVAQSRNKEATTTVFPNPASDIFSVELNLAKPEYLRFDLYDTQGRLVANLMRDWVKVQTNTFSFNTRDLEKGTYLLEISGNNGTRISKKVLVN